jgi:TonB-linked SusC/RagA family outer membrane protein
LNFFILLSKKLIMKFIKLKLCSVIVFLCFIPHLAFAQTITVRGTVTDNTGTTLPGVTVLVANSLRGVPTDINGKYSITTEANDALVFSYVGYRSLTVTINGRTEINVVLEDDIQVMEELVVIAYGQQSKATITGSIVSVNSEELLKSPTTSLGNALAGRLPGFSAIQYSGLPGFDDPTVFVRGVGTLSTGQSSPLVLVDGVERSFTQIDPNEVADITILKDAGATAVFGVRGANGVILVTTKRGEAGKPRITASASFGLQQPVKIVKFADSYTYARTYNAAQRSDGVSEDRLRFSETAIKHWQLMDQPLLYPSVDWMSYILKEHASQDQYNINVSGGNDKAKYFVSLGVLSQNGMFETFDSDPNSNFNYNRYNYRTNLDINLTNTTTLSLNLGGRIEDRNGTNDVNDESSREGFIFRYLVEAIPMAGAGIVDGKHIYQNANLVGLAARRDGLWAHYARGYRNEVTNVLNLDVQLTQKLNKITQGLDWRFKGSYNNSFGTAKIRSTGNSLTGMPIYVPYPVYNDAGEIADVVLEKTTDRQTLGYSESYSYRRDWYFETSFNYQRKFGFHNLTSLLLYNQTKRYYPGQYADIPNGYIGMVGRITYDYATRYLLDLNLGINGSENFAEGKRYGVFPSGSIGWVVSEEDFMSSLNFIDYLKIRYSYGIVGSDRGVGNNRFLYMPPSYVTGPPRNLGAPSDGYGFGTIRNVWQPNVRESSMGNPNVTWEKARKQNIGIDLTMLNNRLGINVDLFKENRRDILINSSSTIPAYMAFPTQPPVNFGKVDNHGYELVVSWQDKIGRDIKYTIAPNVSFNRNKIIEQAEIPQNYDYQYRTGHKVGQPFGYEFFAFYEGEKTEQAYKAKYGKDFPNHVISLSPGDCTFVDLNGDGEINDEDQWAIGYPDYPEYTFGLTLGFSYKRFDISALWIGATNTNRDLAGAYRPAFGSQDDSALLMWVAENSWTPENTNAKFPRISFANKDHNARFSRVYLVDSSYARLKNLEISYNMDVSSVPFVNSIRLYVTGYNLLTFTKYKANDPETTGAGYGQFFRYPPTRVYNLGLRVSF